MGELLRQEAERLQTHLGLVERHIVVSLPKLSANQIEDLLEQLQASDSTIARTNSQERRSHRFANRKGETLGHDAKESKGSCFAGAAAKQDAMVVPPVTAGRE
jgi:uncharacterized protein with PIN domain